MALLRRMFTVGFVCLVAGACGESAPNGLNPRDGVGGTPAGGADGGAGSGGAGMDGDSRGSAGTGGALGAGGSGGALPRPMFVADDERYVVMEMESVAIPDQSEWVSQADLGGFTGDGYYRFTGNGICNGPAGSPLRYTFEIREAARYELRLRAAKISHCVLGAPQANGTCTEHDRTCDSLGEPTDGSCGSEAQCIRNDISNDAFVHIEDDGGSYVAFVDQPADSVGEPIKLFGGQPNSWAWTGTKALDRSGKWNAHWDLGPGTYTLVVQGRSQSFRIDRMLLFDTNTGTTSGAVERAETR
ncbi:MAG: hypothetical protein AAGF92_15845 [Myxococcota bacterium]